jgi:hypothetical protein
MFRDTLIVYADGTPRTRHIITNVIIEAAARPQSISSSM